MKPKIVSLRAPNAPIALEDGKTVIHVIAEGSGTLVIGNVRHKFKDGLDALFLVDTAPTIRVTARGMFTSDTKEISLNVMKPPAMLPAPDIALPTTVVPSVHVRLDALQPRK